MGSEALLYLMGVPFAAGILCLVIPDRLKLFTRSLVFLVTLASLMEAGHLLRLKSVSWPMGAVSHSGDASLFVVDGLSGVAGAAVAFFAFLIAIYSFATVKQKTGRYFAYYLMTLSGSFGAVFSSNLLILTAFWGFLAVTFFLLINTKETVEAMSSAKKALIIIGGTDSLMILGVCLVGVLAGTFHMKQIHLMLNTPLTFFAFLLLICACFAKAGAMPFHSWLPEVAKDGPTPVTAYLPASLDKVIGIYLLVRVSTGLFVMTKAAGFVLLLAGSTTVILAVIFALVQHDFKRLLGFHAVSQVGYMIMGIGTGLPIGIAGGLFHMLNNAVYKSCLFLCSGSVEEKTGTTDLAGLGGLAKGMPVTFASFLIASLAISGIPPFNGFVSKWMIYQSLVELGKNGDWFWLLWLVSAMFGSAFTLASFVKLIHAVFLGRPSQKTQTVREAGFLMSAPVAVLALICVIFGVFAFVLPLPKLIAPAIGQPITYTGYWNPAMATGFLFIGLLIGVLVWWLDRAKGWRSEKPFVGGIDVEEFGRVSGVDFYTTIKEVKGLDFVYQKEEAGWFDPYVQARKGLAVLTGFFERLHNGVLPTYLVWPLLGMVAMLLFLLAR